MPYIVLPPALINFFVQFADVILVWGWLFIIFFILWIAWEVYQFIKHVDYVSSIQWTYLQITVPDDAPQTPKAMQQAFEVWGGIEKGPDLLERYFDGYFRAWYSCELHCTRGRARYIMVVPTAHQKFFEGVIYGQYPTATIQEVEDYTLQYAYTNIEKTFDLYGTELELVEDDIYPVRKYLEYEDALAEDERFIDPHQSVVEAFTTIDDGEEFWFQLLVRPTDAKIIAKWSTKGEEKMLEIGGQAKKKASGIVQGFYDTLKALPGDLLRALTGAEAPELKREEGPRFLTPAQAAKIEGILSKVSRTGFKCKMRVIHISPAGKLHKPNISKAIGVFKQFNTFNLNSLRPEATTKTNGPNYILKQSRRHFRKRSILLNYQWRDFWGEGSGQMLDAEELATLFHFPNKYGKSPSIERATAGLGSAPENLPYV